MSRRTARPREAGGEIVGARVRAVCGFTSIFALTALAGCDRKFPPLAGVTRDATAALFGALRRAVERNATGAERRGDRREPLRPTREPAPETAIEKPSHGFEAKARTIDSERPLRVYAKTRFVWVREQPTWSSPWLGYLFPGESVELKSTRAVYAIGCDVWYEVRPRGFVCVDGKRATLDPNDRDFRTVADYAPDYDKPLPHRYAESLGAERYETLPTQDEQRAREADFRHHLKLLGLARSGEPRDPSLLGVDISLSTEEASPFATLPVDVQIRRNTLKRDSAIAYAAEYRHEGRSFLLTPDFAWVPKDRVRPYEPAPFRGVALDATSKLPLAFFRERDQPQFKRVGPATFEPNGASFARLSSMPLTRHEEASGAETFVETIRAGIWVRKADAVIPTPSDETPWGQALATDDSDDRRPKGRATWVEVSIYGGWLIAYEGTHPVYATLISPGRGGAPHEGKNPLLTASTPIGRFSVSGKFLTATMDAPDGVTHTDVPWTQNFSGPHAIHAAYWHDAWGERVSGGCVNVSPEDGFWLFRFSEPALPEGWHGVRADTRFDGATIVMIHR